MRNREKERERERKEGISNSMLFFDSQEQQGLKRHAIREEE